MNKHFLLGFFGIPALLAVSPIAFAQTESSTAASVSLPTDQRLHDELLLMEQRDQDIRQKLVNSRNDPSVMNQAVAIDAKDTSRMRQIVAQYGWPSSTLVGKGGVDAAWLLIQHADADPTFQSYCLPKVRAAAERGEVSKHDLALLTDRVMLAQGKKQIYGTQFTLSKGDLHPLPIEDSSHVDARRRAMGLMPIAEYRSMLMQVYKVQK